MRRTIVGGAIWKGGHSGMNRPVGAHEAARGLTEERSPEQGGVRRRSGRAAAMTVGGTITLLLTSGIAAMANAQAAPTTTLPSAPTPVFAGCEEAINSPTNTEPCDAAEVAAFTSWGGNIGLLYADDLPVDLGVWEPIGDDDWAFNESVLYACIGVSNGDDEFEWLDEQLLGWTDYSASANEKLFDAAMQYVCPDLGYQRQIEWDFHVPASFTAGATTSVPVPTTVAALTTVAAPTTIAPPTTVAAPTTVAVAPTTQPAVAPTTQPVTSVTDFPTVQQLATDCAAQVVAQFPAVIAQRGADDQGSIAATAQAEGVTPEQWMTDVMIGALSDDTMSWLIADPWSGATTTDDPPNEFGAMMGLALNCLFDRSGTPADVIDSYNSTDDGEASYNRYRLTWSIEATDDGANANVIRIFQTS
jgi:hypothetical protein